MICHGPPGVTTIKIAGFKKCPYERPAYVTVQTV